MFLNAFKRFSSAGVPYLELTRRLDIGAGGSLRYTTSADYLTLGTNSSTYGSGLKLTSSKTSVLRAYGDDGAAVIGNAAVRSGVFRFLNTVSQTGETSMFGAQGQFKIKAPLDCTLTSGNRAGSWNYCELAGTADKTITLSGSNKFTGGAFAMAEWDGIGALTISSGHYFGGIGVLTNVKSGLGTFTRTGVFAAYSCFNNYTAGYTNFDYGMYLSGCTRGIYFDVTAPADAGNYGQTIDSGWIAVDPGSGGSFGGKLMFSNTDTSGYTLYGLGLRCRAYAASAIAVGLNVSASAAVASAGQLIGGQFYLQNSGSYTIVGAYESTALYCKSWLTAACGPSASALWIDDESSTKATAQYMVDITMNGSVEIDKVFHIYGGDPGADTFIDFDTCDQGAGAFVVAGSAGGATRSHKIKCTVNGTTVGYMSLYTD